MSDNKYILYLGSMNPKNYVKRTDEKIKELRSFGYKQGKDYDIVSWKVLKDKLGRRGGGMMNIDEMIRPIGMAGGGLMDQVLDLDTLVKIVKLEGALPNKDTDNLRKMSPIEIEILYNDTFGEGN